MRQPEVLLVEDDPAAVRLMREAMAAVGGVPGFHLNVVSNGHDALKFVRRTDVYRDAPLPDLILLDLNLPGKSGHEVLAELKFRSETRMIPVIILSLSKAPIDLARAYDTYANCYVSKPHSFDELVNVVRSIEEFWFHSVTLPPPAATH